MSTPIWIISAIVVGAVALFLIRAFLAFAVPESVSGVALLKQELKKRNIPYAHLPQEFYTDCMAFAQKTASAKALFSGNNTPLQRKAEFVKSIELLATLVEHWRRSPDDSTFSSFGGVPNVYRSIFEKYPLQ